MRLAIELSFRLRQSVATSVICRLPCKEVVGMSKSIDGDGGFLVFALST